MKGHRGYEVAGDTTDGKKVMKGLFKMVNQEGLPIDILLDICESKGIIPDWLDFCMDALKCGWPPESVLNRLGPAITDVYGPDYRDVIIDRLEGIFNSKEGT